MDASTENRLKELAISDVNSFMNEIENWYDEHGFKEHDYETYWYDWDATAQVGNFKFDVVYSEGGIEGGGDHAERVFTVSLNDEILAHVCTTGFYGSYSGTDWSNAYHAVYPRQVVVTQYFRTKE